MNFSIHSVWSVAEVYTVRVLFCCVDISNADGKTEMSARLSSVGTNTINLKLKRSAEWSQFMFRLFLKSCQR